MKKRYFLGSKDKSAIIVEGMFDKSDLVVSTPVEFKGTRSGVYIEGDPGHVEKIFQCLLKLVKKQGEFPRLTDLIELYEGKEYFGRWLTVTPPDEISLRTIIHYETLMGLFDKIPLLIPILRQHLAKICNVKMSQIFTLTVRIDEIEIQRSHIALPKSFVNGSILLSKSA